jgi:hypothetical protein
VHDCFGTYRSASFIWINSICCKSSAFWLSGRPWRFCPFMFASCWMSSPRNPEAKKIKKISQAPPRSPSTQKAAHRGQRAFPRAGGPPPSLHLHQPPSPQSWPRAAFSSWSWLLSGRFGRRPADLAPPTRLLRGNLQGLRREEEARCVGAPA